MDGERDDFPLIVEVPRPAEVLGAGPMAAGLARAVLGGVAMGLLFELGGWMLHDGDAVAAIRPALIAGSACLAAMVVLSLLEAGKQRGERFTFWEDRFERSGPGGMWIMRYAEIASVQFRGRGRIDIVSRGGQPRTVKHLAFSFMQRLQECGGEDIAKRLCQLQIESGRPVTLREPLPMPLAVLCSLLYWIGAAAGVWFCLALYMKPEEGASPYAILPAAVTMTVCAVIAACIGLFAARRTQLTNDGVVGFASSIAWRDVERVTCEMSGVVVHARKNLTRAYSVSWYATNAVALPFVARHMTRGEADVDVTEWGAPWQLMEAEAPPK